MPKTWGFVPSFTYPFDRYLQSICFVPDTASYPWDLTMSKIGRTPLFVRWTLRTAGWIWRDGDCCWPWDEGTCPGLCGWLSSCLRWDEVSAAALSVSHLSDWHSGLHSGILCTLTCPPCPNFHPWIVSWNQFCIWKLRVPSMYWKEDELGVRGQVGRGEVVSPWLSGVSHREPWKLSCRCLLRLLCPLPVSQSTEQRAVEVKIKGTGCIQEAKWDWSYY